MDLVLDGALGGILVLRDKRVVELVEHYYVGGRALKGLG